MCIANIADNDEVVLIRYWVSSHSLRSATSNYNTYVDHSIIKAIFTSTITTFHRQFYLSDVNAYSLIPLRSTIKVSVVPIDVIHPLGFYSFGIKIDAIPGRINPASSSRSLNKGENRGFRSESRGQGHSTMLLISMVLLFDLLYLFGLFLPFPLFI